MKKPASERAKARAEKAAREAEEVEKIERLEAEAAQERLLRRRAKKAEASDFAPWEDRPKLPGKVYAKELVKLQRELVKLQEYVRAKGIRVLVIFEGRDAAGKGGAIKRITEVMSPRVARVAALSAPSPREKTSWYFQRYLEHLPAAGEIVLFDRSWYNRAGVERVMGFCTEDELDEFFRTCPELERMLVRSGIVLIKYWFSVSQDEQEKRFQSRLEDPIKRWKLSPMDLEARARWDDYSHAKDELFRHTDIPECPWWVVPADDKKRARLNAIDHLLSCVHYEDLSPPRMDLPPPPRTKKKRRSPFASQRFVPQKH